MPLFEEPNDSFIECLQTNHCLPKHYRSDHINIVCAYLYVLWNLPLPLFGCLGAQPLLLSQELLLATGSGMWMTWGKIRAREVEALKEHINPVDKNIKSHGKMSEETVCPSWTVQYTLKKTGPSTLRCTKNLNTEINTLQITVLQICTIGTQNNLYIKERHFAFLWGQQCKHLGQKRQMVWKRSKGVHLCHTGTTSIERRRWPMALLTTHLQCGTEFSPQTA